MLSSRIQSAPASRRVAHAVQVVGLHLHQDVGHLAARAGDGVDQAGAGQGEVVVLHEHPVVEAHPVVDAAAGAHRVLLQGAQPGRRLARVEHLRRARRPPRRRPSGVATPDRWQSRLSRVRSAVSTARAGPSISPTTVPGSRRSPSRGAPVARDAGLAAAPPRPPRVRPARRPGGRRPARWRGASAGHQQRRGDVAPPAEVLGQRQRRRRARALTPGRASGRGRAGPAGASRRPPATTLTISPGGQRLEAPGQLGQVDPVHRDAGADVLVEAGDASCPGGAGAGG